jgi:hypothetical protein
MLGRAGVQVASQPSPSTAALHVRINAAPSPSGRYAFAVDTVVEQDVVLPGRPGETHRAVTWMASTRFGLVGMGQTALIGQQPPFQLNQFLADWRAVNR